MPLNATQLGTAMANAARAATVIIPTDEPVTDAQIDQIYKNLAQEIVNHIVTNGLVTVPGVQLGAGVGLGTIS